MVASEPFGHRASEWLGDVVGHGGVQGDIDLQSLRAGSFGKTLQVERIQFFFEPLSYLRALKNVGRRAGIEIKNNHRRTFNILLFSEKRMQFEVAQICCPDD